MLRIAGIRFSVLCQHSGHADPRRSIAFDFDLKGFLGTFAFSTLASRHSIDNRPEPPEQGSQDTRVKEIGFITRRPELRAGSCHRLELIELNRRADAR